MTPVTRNDLTKMSARLARNLTSATGENTAVGIDHACPGVWRAWAGVVQPGPYPTREGREIAVGTSKGELFRMIDAACKALEYVSERQRGAAHLARSEA